MTQAEINERIRDIDLELEQLQARSKKLGVVQLAIKLIINSIYGAFGNQYFYFHNIDIAASITAQGQDLIKFSIAVINHYFKNIWHKDVKTHEKLGIETERITPITVDTAIYADTDSTYVNFDPMIYSIKGLHLTKEEQTKFCVEFVNVRFSDYLTAAFDRYSIKSNTDNRQEFKLETISDAGIWMAKKNYSLRVRYDGEAGIYLDEPEIMKKGIDAAKPSFPPYAREKLEIILMEVLEKGTDIDVEGWIIPKLISYRKGFRQLPVSDICMNKYVRKYNDWVDTDKELIIKDKMPIGARSALYYNHLIERTNIRKYNKIREGNKVKTYKAKDKRPGYEDIDVFSFLPGNYPDEFAPDVDHDQQFYETVVQPVNKMLGAMNIQHINVDLKRHIEIERIKVKRQLTDDEIYPMHCLDTESLEHIEIPRDIAGMIYENKEVPASMFGDYLEYTGKYGFNTKVVPNRELPGLITRLRKKKFKENLKNMGKQELRTARNENLVLLNDKKKEIEDLTFKLDSLRQESKELKKKNPQRSSEIASEVTTTREDIKEAKSVLKFYESLEKDCIERARAMVREKTKSDADAEAEEETD